MSGPHARSWAREVIRFPSLRAASIRHFVTRSTLQETRGREDLAGTVSTCFERKRMQRARDAVE